MQEMKWIFLDDIEYDRIEDVPIAIDPEVGNGPVISFSHIRAPV